MSPLKASVSKEGSPKLSKQRNIFASKVADSPRRLTRFATAQARENDRNEDMPVEQSVDGQNSMNRNLEIQFGSSENRPETLSQIKRQELIEYYPSFDLGFDEPNSSKTTAEVGTSQEIVVISSNESGDSLDKIYANIDMPTRIPSTGKGHVAEDAPLTACGPNSSTPIPEAHKKRIVKPSQTQKSPFLGCSKKETATKYANEVYSRLLDYGGASTDVINKRRIIDDGKFYIHVRDLADSVRPGAQLSNTTCELALRVLAQEMEKQKKHVMPLMMAVSFKLQSTKL
jgi:hypothetical protein